MTPGTAWRYATDGADEVQRSWMDTRQVLHGTDTLGLRQETGGQVDSIAWFSLGPDGLFLHRRQDDESPDAMGFDTREPLLMLPASLEPGTTYSHSGAVGEFESTMQPPDSFLIEMRVDVSVGDFESITTAAGTFNALRIDIVESRTRFGIDLGSTDYALWLAENVGVVRDAERYGTLDLTSFSGMTGSGTEIHIASITRDPVGRVQIRFSSEAGAAYAIEMSDLLDRWTTLDTIPGQAETTTFSDATAAASERRFYRIRRGAAVAPNLPRIATPPRGQTVVEGSHVTLSVEATGEGLRFQWFKNRAALTGETQATLNLDAVVADNAGSYTVQVTNDAGTVTSDPAALVVTSGSTENPIATMPEPGRVYPAGTTFGGSLFGVEYRVAPEWKGGLRVGTPITIFVSDTKPGLILGLVGFAWTEDQILNDNELDNGFELDLGDDGSLFFFPAQPMHQVKAGRIQGEFTASDETGVYSLTVDIVTHPSGGYVGFMGLTAAEQSATMKTQVAAFADGVKTTPRPTDQAFMNQIVGRSFKWAGDGDTWYAGNLIYSPPSSLADWSHNFALFCGEGTVQIDSTSVTYVQAAKMSQSFSSTSTDFGEWTVIQHPQFGRVMLLVTRHGYLIAPTKLDPDGTLYVMEKKLVFDKFVTCAE